MYRLHLMRYLFKCKYGGHVVMQATHFDTHMRFILAMPSSFISFWKYFTPPLFPK